MLIHRSKTEGPAGEFSAQQLTQEAIVPSLRPARERFGPVDAGSRNVTYSVLLVDDEEDIRNALGRCLRRDGYDLIGASSGPEALTILRQRPVDIIISDQMMPEMTGLELITAVKDEYPKVVRIILTGYADFDTVKAAINEAEIYRFLTKPWDDDDLRLTVRHAAERLALQRDNLRLTVTVRHHEERLRELERLHPGITAVRRDEGGAIVIDEEP